MKGQLGGSLPIAGTEIAGQWDSLYLFLFYISVFFFVIVIGPMVLFAIKYRARPGHKPTYISHHNLLEFMWTAIPTVLVMIIFVWGWVVYDRMTAPPRDAMEVRVLAQSWSWTFQYEDGRTTTNQLFVPVGRDVKLVMTSKTGDVLHSFFVPNFRVKQDVVPGIFTYVWFRAESPGQHQVFCTEYCGVGHSDMLAKLIVLDAESWKQWKWGKEVPLPPHIGVGGQMASTSGTYKAEDLKNLKTVQLAPVAALAEHGKYLSESLGCTACHSSDGSKRIGPSYKGLFGSEVVLKNGDVIRADENYISESIRLPHAKIKKGYENVVMPTYVDQVGENEMNSLIAYIRSLN